MPRLVCVKKLRTLKIISIHNICVCINFFFLGYCVEITKRNCSAYRQSQPKIPCGITMWWWNKLNGVYKCPWKKKMWCEVHLSVDGVSVYTKKMLIWNDITLNQHKERRMRARTYYTKFCFLTAQPLTDNVTESKLRKNRNSASIEHQRQTLTHMHKSAALIIVLCHTNSFLHVVCVLNARILNHHTEFM